MVVERLEGADWPFQGILGTTKKVVDKLTASFRVAKYSPESLDVIDRSRQKNYEVLSDSRKLTLQETEILKKEGFVFVSPQTRSLKQLVKDCNFQYVDNSLRDLTSYTGPETEIAINLKNPFIPGSFNKPILWMYEKIEERSRQFQEQGLSNVRSVILPVSSVVELAIANKNREKNKTRRCFLQTSYTLALEMCGSNGIRVGRNPDGKLIVCGNVDLGGSDIVGLLDVAVAVKK